VAEGHECRVAKRRPGRGLGREFPPPRDGVNGCHPGKNGKILTDLNFSTFMNENLATMLDSAIDIVAYYFNFLTISLCFVL